MSELPSSDVGILDVGPPNRDPIKAILQEMSSSHATAVRTLFMGLTPTQVHKLQASPSSLKAQMASSKPEAFVAEECGHCGNPEMGIAATDDIR